jgi:hypothetical protein
MAVAVEMTSVSVVAAAALSTARRELMAPPSPEPASAVDPAATAAPPIPN